MSEKEKTPVKAETAKKTVESAKTPEAKTEKKSPEQIQAEPKKKKEGITEKLESSKTKLKETKERENDKKKFLHERYSYEANSNNPPDPTGEDAGVEEFHLGDEKKEREKAEKEVMQSLKEKHEAEIQEALEDIDFDSMEPENRRAIHADTLAKNIKLDTVSKSIKETALKWVTGPDGQPIDVTKPLSEAQQEIIRQYQAAQYLKALADANIPEEEKQDPAKFKSHLEKLEDQNPGLTDFASQQKIELLTEKTFFEAAKKDPDILQDTIQSIKTEGMVKSGIDPKSSLWKKLTAIIRWNADAYLEVFMPEEGTIDIENFKNLKDVLGSSYADLFYWDEEFILGKEHPLKKTRDTILETFKDAAAQHDIEPTPDGFHKYQQKVEKDFSEATGLEGKNALQDITNTARSRKLSPFVKFLADILAPFWAMFGGETGDFWRRYMSENNTVAEQGNNAYGKGQSQPFEWKGIENASASGIFEAASAEIWKNEAKDPQLIREMHKYAGLNAPPSTPWCMSFVQYVLRKKMWFNSAQIWPPTASAADGHRIGKHSDLEHAKPGDLVLIERSGGSGRHIGFYAGRRGNQVLVLWWNQGNSVSIAAYAPGKVKEIRSLEQWEQIAADVWWKKPGEENANYPGKTAAEFFQQSGVKWEMPAWMRNNNPFNMKYSNTPFQRSNYVGMVWPSENTDQWDPQIVFSSPEAGMYSGAVLVLHKYKNRWFDTVRKMLASANGLTSDKTARNWLWNNAAEEIASRMWVNPDQTLNFSDPKTLKRFIRSYITQEHGNASMAYTDNMIEQAVSKAIS